MVYVYPSQPFLNVKTKIIFFNFIGLTFLKRVRLYCYAYYTERDITMNAIQSTTILYNEIPTITQIHHFYALMTTFQTNVFIGKHGALTSIKNLSTLVSFFLTIKKRTCIIYL